MPEKAHGTSSLVLFDNEPLIGVIFEEDGREVIRFFASEEEARLAVTSMSTCDALSLAGAWKDLDWDQMAGELHRIRHDSPPSPPLSL